MIINDSATNQVSSEITDLLEAENALIVYSGFGGFILPANITNNTHHASSPMVERYSNLK